jgi:hydrogenase maturation protease
LHKEQEDLNSMELVIGVGNPFRGDDAAGIEVARRLRQARIPGLAVLEHQCDGTSLIDAWDGAGEVVIVDAVSSDGTPGTIYRFDAVIEEIPEMMRLCSTHLFSIGQAVGLARALGRLPRKLIVYGIEGGNSSVGALLTPAVAEAVDKVVNLIARDRPDRT